MTENAQIMTLQELSETCGHGWIEIWREADDEGPEVYWIIPCAWCMGGVVWSKNDFTTTDAMAPTYGKRYGLRVWSCHPKFGEWGNEASWHDQPRATDD